MRACHPLPSALFLTLVALASCHGMKSVGHFSKDEPPSAESVERGRALVLFEPKDVVDLPDGLESWMCEFLEAVASGDPAAALSYFDPDHREYQRSIGLLDDAQYVLEGLGLSRRSQLGGRQLSAEPDFSKLLSSLELLIVTEVFGGNAESKVSSRDWYVVQGRMHFTAKQVFLLQIDVRRLDGRWVVSPPVG